MSPFIQPHSSFATTRWSLVLAAGSDSGKQAEALEDLCRRYWHPVYVYVRRKVLNVALAQDLTQGFFLEILDGDFLKRATPLKGRFRSFLLGACQKYVARYFRDGRAIKRGGGKPIVSLEALRADEGGPLQEPNHQQTPELLYEKKWAETLIHQAILQLEQEWSVDEEKRRRYERLRMFLSGSHGGSYVEAAEDLALSPANVRQLVSRLRRECGQLLRQAIAQTLGSTEEVDEELHHLFAVVQK